MANAYYHSVSSARIFGGQPEDYIGLHNWMDSSKAFIADHRHRAVHHHAEGLFEAERVHGNVIINSDGKKVPVRVILEQHIIEDMGRIPTLSEWLELLPMKPWMSRSRLLDQNRGHRARREEISHED